ncbi:MAG: hypothetical protein POELPBGB_03610 [Bacteroidia bacterium]|nr:hypothetical protein [Bacteroidia bacterium]
MKKIFPILLLLFSATLKGQETDTIPGSITSVTMQVSELPNNNPYAERDSTTGMPFPLHMVNSEVNVSSFNHVKGADVKLGKTAGAADLLNETYYFNQPTTGNIGSSFIDQDKIYITSGAFEHRNTFYLEVKLIYDDDSRSSPSSANAQ